MGKKVLMLGCLLLAFLSMHAQSAWRIFPDRMHYSKTLRNTYTTHLYNHELEIERINVENNHSLLVQLRCPSHSLEYKSEFRVKKLTKEDNYVECVVVKPENPCFFFPGEEVQIRFDLSPFHQDGEYHLEFELYTELNEIFEFHIFFNTKEFPDYGIQIRDYFNDDYEKEQEDENYVYSFIENMPEYPGGEEDMKRFIKEHIKPENLPSDLHRLHYVDVGVLVDKDGTLLYPEIVYGNHEGLYEEAVRIVRLMPKWEPGSINGKKVRCSYMIEFSPKKD